MIGRYLLAAASGLALLTSSAQAASQLPDLVAVVPHHLNVPESGRKVIRFSTGIANIGAGPLEFHAINVPPVKGEPAGVTTAVQWIYDQNGRAVQQVNASTAAYHPEHKHYHVGDVATFEIRANTVTGPLVGSGVKVTFCLINWVKVDGGGVGPEKTYFDCESQDSIQGISPGWVDQYHHSTPGQELPMPQVPGIYYLKNIVNPNGAGGAGLHPIESRYDNNVGWIKFEIYRSGSALKLRTIGTGGGLDAVKTNR